MEVGSDQSMSWSDDSTYTVHDDSTYTVHDDSMYTAPDESMYTVHACHERAGVFAELLVIRVQMNLLQGSNGWFLHRASFCIFTVRHFGILDLLAKASIAVSVKPRSQRLL